MWGFLIALPQGSILTGLHSHLPNGYGLWCVGENWVVWQVVSLISSKGQDMVPFAVALRVGTEEQLGYDGCRWGMVWDGEVEKVLISSLMDEERKPLNRTCGMGFGVWGRIG